VNLERTRLRSPVDGYVANLLVRRGDYVTISVVDANSFWIDGYFEETNLAPIRVGDPAEFKLMGYSQTVRGHVHSIAREINVANAQPNGQGVATVNPIFTWVRLAQRIPVRIHLDRVPEGITLVAGMTCRIEVVRVRVRLAAGNHLAGVDEAGQTIDRPLIHDARIVGVGFRIVAKSSVSAFFASATNCSATDS
jgi:multidrug resistance efflux pump